MDVSMQFAENVMKATEFAVRYELAPATTVLECEEGERLLACAVDHAKKVYDESLCYLVEVDARVKRMDHTRSRTSSDAFSPDEQREIAGLAFWENQTATVAVLLARLGIQSEYDPQALVEIMECVERFSTLGVKQHQAIWYWKNQVMRYVHEWNDNEEERVDEEE